MHAVGEETSVKQDVDGLLLTGMRIAFLGTGEFKRACCGRRWTPGIPYWGWPPDRALPAGAIRPTPILAV